MKKALLLVLLVAGFAASLNAQIVAIYNKSGCAVAYQLKVSVNGQTDQTPVMCCIAPGGHIQAYINNYNWMGGASGLGATSTPSQITASFTDMPACISSGATVGVPINVLSAAFGIHGSCNSAATCPPGTTVNVRVTQNRPTNGSIYIEITN